MSLVPDTGKQPMFRAPAATIWLIGILIAAHIARILAPAERATELVWSYGFIPARYSHAYLAAHSANPGTPFERIVPFFSYNFLHADFTHLIVNCVWLLAFGSVVARRLGARLFFLLFFVCGIAGAAAHLALNWGSPVPVIGASGAISGLMGIAFRLIALEPRPEGKPAITPLFAPRIILWSAVWLGVNLLAGVLGLGAGTEVRLIAWQAHMGGYFAGLLLAGFAVAYHDRKPASA